MTSKDEAKDGFVDREKRMADRKSLMDFMTSIQQNKESFSLFYEHAERRGMMEKSPQRKFQHQYYDAYIKPQIDMTFANQFDSHSKPKSNTMRHTKNMSVGGGDFIPLRDLLKRNHDDRVQDYLFKMNEESTDDVMNGGLGKAAPTESAVK